MLKTTGSSITSASRVDDNEVIVGGGAVGQSDASKKLAKCKSWPKSGHLSFLTSKAKEAFNHLRQAFIKVPILQYFDPKCHIQIETDISGYIMGAFLSQLTPNRMTSDETIRSNVDWHPVVYFFRKMIPAETWYETHNNELLAIVKAFKTW